MGNLCCLRNEELSTILNTENPNKEYKCGYFNEFYKIKEEQEPCYYTGVDIWEMEISTSYNI